MIYLDYSATCPIKPGVLDVMVEALGEVGNASSVHRAGQIARQRIERARRQVSDLFGLTPDNIAFTSGATESNAMIGNGCGRPVVVSAIEHPSMKVWATPELSTIPVTNYGNLDLDSSDKIISGLKTPSLISVMLVNNETGAIQQVADIAHMAHVKGHIMHCDVAQAVGKIKIDCRTIGADFITISAHKIGGPQGVGAVIRNPFSKRNDDSANHSFPNPVLRGGGQEYGRRAGTENVAAIAGFGEAAACVKDDLDKLAIWQNWRDNLVNELSSAAGEKFILAGQESECVPSIVCFALKDVKAITQVMAMDLAGFAISAGAACSSGSLQASPVLKAMGWDDKLAECAVRISFGWGTSEEDLRLFSKTWKEKVLQLTLKS